MIKCNLLLPIKEWSVARSLLVWISKFSTSCVVKVENLEFQNFDDLSSTRIIEEKDILRPSLTKSGTGLHVLDLVNRGSLEPSRALYHLLLKRCTLFKKLKEGQLVHAHLLNSHFELDLVMQNTILNMYAKFGYFDVAHKLFNEMPNKDVVTWTVLITGYSQHDRPTDALLLFPQMLRLGFQPNHFTLSSLLATSHNLYGTLLHAFCIKYGYSSNVYVGSSLLDTYARNDCMEEAMLIFDHLTTKNEVSWNAVIAGFVRKADLKQAFLVFSKMRRENIQPTHFTYSIILSACANIGSLEQGKWFHALLIKFGGKLVDFVGNALLNTYAKSGSIEEAKKVFDGLEKQDVVSWNSMLSGYAQHGLGRMTLQMFERMLTTGVVPNDITFLCVLTGCSHAGLLAEGLHYFKLMRKYKVEPQLSHYVTVVDLLGRAGQLVQAIGFIREMPIAPTAAVWGALLGACKMHKNMELGAYAAERICELVSHDSGTHMLLYNIFASAGKWSDAAKVRKMMRESKVKKEPACSWVELKNKLHMFVADDNAHPQIEEIRKMWEKISDKIKEMGYLPDSSHVALLMDQQEREEKLQYHSEKLALAFALLEGPSGSTICIKKNIRVCGDCHSAFKFVSKLVGRKIIVRDTKRFHHFDDGLCSCGDYW